jgi:hypothetical protein
VQRLGGTNKAVLTALYDGIAKLPRRKMAGFFRMAGYDAPDTERDLRRTTLVTLVTAAAAAAAAAALVLKYKRKR